MVTVLYSLIITGLILVIFVVVDYIKMLID